MAQVPTPPASRQTSESPEVQHKGEGQAAAGVDVDSLLERYLGLLDRHQKLQADLAKQLSSGFLSLAQANYTCPPGRRYGADYYDERMKATRRVLLHPSQPVINEPDNARPENPCVFTVEACPEQESEQGTQQENEQETAEDPPVKDTTTTTPTNKSHAEDDTDDDTTQVMDSPKPSQPRKKFRSSDPLTWYGILVPPSLRSSQKSFMETIEKQIPALATVVAEMQAVEKEIGRARDGELGRES